MFNIIVPAILGIGEVVLCEQMASTPFLFRVLISLVVSLALVLLVRKYYFGAPISIKKRRMILTLVGAIITLFLSQLLWQQTSLLRDILFVVTFSALGTAILALHRVDYYFEDIVEELYLVCSFMLFAVLTFSYWEWAILKELPMLAMILTLTILVVLLLLIAFFIFRTGKLIVGGGIFSLFMIIHGIRGMSFSPWYFVSSLLAATIIAYVCSDALSKTNAETKLAKNKQESIYWIAIGVCVLLLIV